MWGCPFFPLLCLVSVWEAREFAKTVTWRRIWMWHRVASVVMGPRFDTAHGASCLPCHMVSSDVLMILMLSLPHFSFPCASFIIDTEPVLHLWLCKELTQDFSHTPSLLVPVSSLSFCFCLPPPFLRASSRDSLHHGTLPRKMRTGWRIAMETSSHVRIKESRVCPGTEEHNAAP